MPVSAVLSCVDVSRMHFPHRESRSRSLSNPNPSSSSLPPIPSKPAPKEGPIFFHHPHLPHVHHPTQPHTTASPSLTTTTALPPTSTSRRGSWLSNISSRFSSAQNAESQAPSASPTPPSSDGGSLGKSQPPGFLISTLRKLSTPGRSARGGVCPNGGRCERVILNRDVTRERCKITELDEGKLRKVAFCVDVEVAPINEDMEGKRIEKKRRKAEREKEKAAAAEREKGADGAAGDAGSEGSGEVRERRELTKEEKQARKEKKKERRANENGYSTMGRETPLLDSEASSAVDLAPGEDATKAATARKIHTRPTTDPSRIYKQVCQLRETQQLPKVTDQLQKSAGAIILQTLDLSGHQFLLPDAVALSDFLALVPVKNLLMESCALTDEMVRVVLCGLAVVKPLTLSGGNSKREDKLGRGVIERLSFKDNPKIGRDGWRYISLFIHMSRSLRAIDLSMIILPRPPSIHAPSHPGHPGHIKGVKKERVLPPNDTTAIFARALGERLAGVGLEEVALGGCGLSGEQLACVLVGIVKGGTKRLGLARNRIGDDALAMVARWIKGGVEGRGECEALDLSNNSIQEHVDMISASLTDTSPLIALSLSNCNLSATSLSSLLPALTALPRFRLLDLSNNPLLFSSQPDALPLLRKYLPKLHSLRKLQLANTSMTPDHAIALSEILPDIPMLAHFDITGNTMLLPTTPITVIGEGEEKEEMMTGGGSLEEGAALFTALVAAVKVSRTIVRVDTDDLGASTGDVIKALARRVLAYCLRNMEAGACDDWTIDMPRCISPTTEEDNDDDDDDDDEFDEQGAEWDEEENYVVGGTGVVKALGVCLGNKPVHFLQRVDTGVSVGSLEEGGEKANEMARMLLGRARKIKERIQPALKKAVHGELEEMHHRRLLFLDETLYKVILRFEQEYPECKLPLASITEPPSPSSLPASISSTQSLPSPHLDLIDSPSYYSHTTEILRPVSRCGSEVSLASKNLENEEGQMHRLGNFIRKEVLRPQTPDHLHDVTGEEVDETRMGRIKRAVEDMGGDEIRRKVQEGGGVERIIERIGEAGGVYSCVLGGEVEGMTEVEIERLIRREYSCEGAPVGVEGEVEEREEESIEGSRQGSRQGGRQGGRHGSRETSRTR